MTVAILDNPDAGGADHGVISSATNTITVTLSSGSNRALLALVAWNSGQGETVSSVVWDPTGANQALTLVPNTSISQSGNSIASALYGLVGYTPGTSKSLTVTFSAATASSYIAPITYTGVDQTGGATSFPHGTTASGSTTAISITVTSATGNMVVGVAAPQNSVTAVSGTGVFSENSIGIGGAGNTDSGAATVTLTQTEGAAGSWVYSACDIKAASASIIETDTYSPPPRTFQPQWNPTKALYRTITQDFSSLGVETNPHWRPNTWPMPWNVNKGLFQNSALDVFPLDVPTYTIPRQFPLQWNISKSLYQNITQDSSSFGVETNPHWIGKTWPVQWRPSQALMRNSDTFAPVQVVQPETNTHFVPRAFPLQWNVQLSLMRSTAQDFSSPGVETNQFFSPRTWPIQWNVQQSLMRGAAQDFSFTPPVIVGFHIVTPMGARLISPIGI